MSQPENIKLAADLRVIAAGMRKKAEEVRKQNMIKAAQVLTAARGLNQLQKILQGGA